MWLNDCRHQQGCGGWWTNVCQSLPSLLAMVAQTPPLSGDEVSGPQSTLISCLRNLFNILQNNNQTPSPSDPSRLHLSKDSTSYGQTKQSVRHQGQCPHVPSHLLRDGVQTCVVGCCHEVCDTAGLACSMGSGVRVDWQ